MTELSVHPHTGYLNTEFSIQSFSEEKKMMHICTVDKKSVSSCSFSLDNKKLMMVGEDGTVVIRNLHLD